jgi:hypothetical protein
MAVTTSYSFASSPGQPHSPERNSLVFQSGILGLMLAMTGLTYVKETALFQVIQSGLWMHVYHFARDFYYPCLALSFALALMATLHPRSGSLRLVTILWMVAGLNVFLLTANNGLNLIQGKPLHCHHDGIGW